MSDNRTVAEPWDPGTEWRNISSEDPLSWTGIGKISKNAAIISSIYTGLYLATTFAVIGELNTFGLESAAILAVATFIIALVVLMILKQTEPAHSNIFRDNSQDAMCCM